MLKSMRLQRIGHDLETEQDKKKIIESTVTLETSKLTQEHDFSSNHIVGKNQPRITSMIL